MRVVFALLATLCLPQLAQSQAPSVETYSQAVLFKNWALSPCIGKAFASDESKSDANNTASAYLEFGKASAEFYEAADKLVDGYLARSYSGSVPGKFNTMKCIDLLHSKELDKLAERAARITSPQK